jgi:hypothetical protein
VEVHWHINRHKTLTKNEVHLLITILHKVRKENIEPFREASPKGGPSGMTIWLKSDEKLTLTLNGEYILYKRILKISELRLNPISMERPWK